MSVGEQTVSDASPQRGEVGRGAQRGRCTPRLLARLGFPPPASPRWGEVQDGGHVAGGASARASPLFPIMSNDHICPDDPRASQGQALPEPVLVGTTEEREDHGYIYRAVSSQVWRRHPAHLDGRTGLEKGELLHYWGVWHPGGFVVPG